MSDWICPICGSDLALLGSDPEMKFSPGRALALALSLVKLLEGANSQEQHCPHPAPQFSPREPIGRVQLWIRDHLRDDLSVAQLARQAGMSQRNFARAFVQETRMTPAEFVEMARLTAARQLLDTTTRPLQLVAFESGFSSTQALRRAFLRRLGMAPREYRAQSNRQGNY